jgi:hypothetical protein
MYDELVRPDRATHHRDLDARKASSQTQEIGG